MNLSVIQQIKEITKESHLSLEQQPLLKSLTAADLDYVRYLKILTKFYSFFSPLEKVIGSFPKIHAFLPDFENRRKASTLLEDMRIISKKENIEPLIEECNNLPLITNPAEAFGCLYVLEGSTLGGRFIYKHLEKTLHLSAGGGASFFYGYGADTADKWKKFKSGFSSYFEAAPEEANFSYKAAVLTFDNLKDCFDNQI